MKRPKLTPIEHKILKTVVENNIFMSTREIALRSGVSWNTAFVYLKRFYNRGWLSKKTVGKRVYWKIK